MAQSGKAVFLSYASQDAGAAKRMADALRAGGVEVWLDQSELRGGDAWDASIREQIRDCSLFLPLVSATTQSRDEGYFRLEWRLAVERSQLMADDRAFIVPLVIDETPEDNARVPSAFHERQWIRLSAATPTLDFVARVKDLLERGGAAAPGSHGGSAPRKRKPRLPWIALGVAVTLTILAVFARPLLDAYRQASTRAAAPAATAALPSSVAVLPFRNLSDDKSNESSPMASARSCWPRCRRYPGCKSPRGLPPSPSRERTPRRRRSAPGSVSPILSKEACASRATACASRPS